MIKLASMESCIEVRNIITGNTTIEKSNEKTTPLVEKKREITTSSTKLKAEVKQPIIEKKEIPPTQNKVSEPTIVEEKTTELNSSITFEVIQEKWSEVLEKLEESNGKIANFLEDVILLGYDETTSTLQLEHNQEFHIKTLKKDNGIIESIINEVFGLKISIVYKLIEKSRDEAISSTKKNEGDKEHPLFMEVLEAIEGEVLR
jgi:NADH:ubiquinone oxidoreductase subunit C